MSDPVPPATAPLASDPIESSANLWRGVVSVFVMGGFALVTGLTMSHLVADNPLAEKTVDTLTVLATTVVGYWMGSSAGSATKTAQMSRAAPTVAVTSGGPNGPGTATASATAGTEAKAI